MPTIIKPDFLDQELSLEDMILPSTVDKVVRYELVNSHRRNRPFRHTLALAGMGGTGKTTLGFALAKELNADQVLLVSAKPVRSEVEFILENIEDGTFLLLDEIHSYANQTWLLDLLEGARGLGRRVDFTAFGATTNKGQLPQTIITRFSIRLDINYSDDELARIADQIASRFEIDLDKEGRDILLRASVGNPRTMRNILGFWDQGPNEAVRMAQLTVDGLDQSAIAMLEYLSDHGKPVGRATLARILEAPGGIQDVESVLIRRRYVSPTPSGLSITHAGIKRIRIRAEKGI